MPRQHRSSSRRLAGSPCLTTPSMRPVPLIVSPFHSCRESRSGFWFRALDTAGSSVDQAVMVVTAGAPLFDFVTSVKTRPIVPGAQPQDKVLLSRGLASPGWADSRSLWGPLIRSVPVSWVVVATHAIIAWKVCGHGVVFRVHRPASVPQLRAVPGTRWSGRADQRLGTGSTGRIRLVRELAVLSCLTWVDPVTVCGLTHPDAPMFVKR
jgi:hypothetical protein